MGNSSAKPEHSEIAKAHEFLNKKEYELIALENEVDKVVGSKNIEELISYKKELNSLLITLAVLRQENHWTKELIERCDRLAYNYELTLCKVMSVLNSQKKVKVRREKTKKDRSARSSAEIGNENKENTTENRNTTVQTPDNNLIEFTDEDDEDGGVIYSNLESIQKKLPLTATEPVLKPPVPIPRNIQETRVKELPKNFEKLQEILEKPGKITEEELKEVYSIKSRFYEAKEIFSEKIQEVLVKYEQQRY